MLHPPQLILLQWSLLFHWETSYSTFTKHHHCPGLTPTIIVCGIWCIYISFYYSYLICTKCETELFCPTKLFHDMVKLSPVIIIWFFHACCEERDRCLNVMMSTVAHKEKLSNIVVKCYSLFLQKFLASKSVPMVKRWSAVGVIAVSCILSGKSSSIFQCNVSLIFVLCLV